MTKRRWLPKIIARCKHCQADFRPKEANRITYCSRECAFAYKRTRAEVRDAAQAQQRQALKEQREIAKQQRLIRTCSVCQVEYQRKGTHGICPNCLEAKRIVRNATPQAKALRTAIRKRLKTLKLHDKGKHRKRAIKFGVAYETVKPGEVFDRDGWMCQLCHEPIDRTAQAPHPLSASLDHVIPMARGGPHTYGNVQAAHFRCNSLKGARMSERQCA